MPQLPSTTCVTPKPPRALSPGPTAAGRAPAGACPRLLPPRHPCVRSSREQFALPSAPDLAPWRPSSGPGVADGAVEGEAAVDQELVPGDVAGGGGGQEDRHVRHLLREPDAAERDPLAVAGAHVRRV